MAATSVDMMSIPFIKTLPHLVDGFMLIVQGWTPKDASSFAINFVCVVDAYNENSDIAFHINPRFFQENIIVRNTMVSRVWGREERETSRMGPQPGERFECIVLVTDDHYKVSFNGRHFCEYQHRLPIQRINKLVIDGNIQLMNVIFQAPGFEAIPHCSEAISESVSSLKSISYTSSTEHLPEEHYSSQVLPLVPCFTDKTSDTLQQYPDATELANTDDISTQDKNSSLPSNSTAYPNCTPVNVVPYPNCISGNVAPYPNCFPNFGSTYQNTSSPVDSVLHPNYPMNSNVLRPPYPNCNPFPTMTQTIPLQMPSTGHHTPPVSGLPQLTSPYAMPHPVPYRISTTHGIQTDRLIIISGMPLPSSSWFSVSIRCHEDPPDVAFLLYTRFHDHLVIRNSSMNGVWNQEEKHMTYFPFPNGAPFDIIILCRPDIFRVAVNGSHFVEYPNHGYALSSVTSVLIEGQLSVTRAFIQ